MGQRSRRLENVDRRVSTKQTWTHWNALMSNEALISTVSQLQAEVETLGLRGLRAASTEQLQWLRHTRDTLSEMGAEFLAAKMTQLLASMEQTQSDAAARLLDLLTTIRVLIVCSPCKPWKAY